MKILKISSKEEYYFLRDEHENEINKLVNDFPNLNFEIIEGVEA